LTVKYSNKECKCPIIFSATTGMHTRINLKYHRTNLKPATKYLIKRRRVNKYSSKLQMAI